MSRTLEIGMLLVRRVTRQTAFADDLRRLVLEDEDFCLVATAGDVFSSGTVTRLATMGLGALFGFQHAVPVPGLLQIFEKILVTGLASIGSDVFRGSRWSDAALAAIVPGTWDRRRVRRSWCRPMLNQRRWLFNNFIPVLLNVHHFRNCSEPNFQSA